MDIRSLWQDFVSQSKELLDRMRSPEGEVLTRVDLHILRVQLRLLDAQAQMLQQVTAAGPGPPLADIHRLKVLFIDPDGHERRSLADGLAKRSPDFVVLEAPDAITGLKLCETEHVDCVVIELDLPDKSGLSVLMNLIPRRQTPEMGVVVLTNPALQALFPLARQHGAHVCLVKTSISATDLDTAIRKAVAAAGPKKRRQAAQAGEGT
jgi:CheY-like chemotaxis protein